MADVDLKIDRATWDLCWDEDDPTTLAMIAGIDLVQQRVEIALRTFLGEWFLDEADGTDYWGKVFTDQPKTNLIEAMFRKRILDDEDIERLSSFSMTVDKRARSISISFDAVSTYGVLRVRDLQLVIS